MPLGPGAKLGPYEGLAPLGAGGRGEVYRARDPRLGREVAIKVLPAEVAGDPERLARFRREAHVLASLNHPNIASIYGLEESDGKPFLVLELVEGETLQERATRGRMPVDEALKIARQVAEALEEAHEHGIVHRDLKPANVKLTGEGKVKVLDFGLAKAYEGDGGGDTADVSHSPTLTRMGTEAGVILGTAAYMSPEQARGKRVDKRADIWAFGVVLFEMLTGQRLFQGETVSDTLASVLKTDPDWSLLPADAPSRVRELLRRCLSRDPLERLRDIGDARLELGLALAGPQGAEAPARSRPAWAIGILAAALGLAAGVALVLRFGSGRGPGEGDAGPPLRFEQLTYRFGHFVNARFAPDGQTVFYAAAWEGRPRELFQARPGSGGELSLGMSGADLLAVSPSGELAVLLPRMRTSNAYWKWGTLAVVPASGGTPRELAEDVVWADWASDGKTLAAIRNVGGGRQLEYPLGTVLYRSPQAGLDWPRVSPDGGRVALFEWEGDSYSVVMFHRSGARRALSTGWVEWWNLAWSPRGDEIWFGGRKAGSVAALYAVSLGGAERRLLEAPRILENTTSRRTAALSSRA